MIEIDVAKGERRSNVSEGFSKAYATTLNSTLITIEPLNNALFIIILLPFAFFHSINCKWASSYKDLL